MWLVGVVVRRYIDFLILLIPPTPLVSVLLQQHPYFFIILKMFFYIIAGEASFLVCFNGTDFLYIIESVYSIRRDE